MSSKADYQEHFQQELTKLNDQQQQAVNQIEGPVLVIAGPGTGKTQMLAARIGKILSTPETQVAPQNILCLTYTDAGTIAMRNRLLSFIGPEAYRVHIHTFHGFCNQVIQDNAELFGLRQLEPISDLEKVELMQELVNSFDQNHPLKRFTGDVYFEIGRLAKLFSTMKTEHWTAELIASKIDEYLADLPLRDAFVYKRANAKQGIKAGDPKQHLIDQEIKRMEKLKAAANEFDHYQQLMQEKSRYDYDDMILWVVDAFQKYPELLRNYQEQYLYFLVDEYQDTNGAQNEILQMLVDFWEAPNVFVVGDDDQSIYRFQGANVENILSFHNHYSEQVKVVMMQDNYRSSQPILNAAQALIDRNDERLTKALPGLSKVLQAKHAQFGSLTQQPEVKAYYNAMHETVAVAHEILSLYNQKVDLSEIAVIYRNHKQAEDIATYLERKGVSLNLKRRINILDTPFVNKLLTILQYLSDESIQPHSREDLLFEIMQYDFFELDSLFAANFAVEMKQQQRSKDALHWRDALARIEQKRVQDLFESNAHLIDPVKRLSDDLEYWIASVQNTTLQHLFEKVITRGGVLSYVMRSPEKVWLIQVLNTLFDFIKAESTRKPRITIKELLQTVELMRKYNIALEQHKLTYAEGGVNFVTAHSSKGLEFEYVFLLGCTSDSWDKPGRSGGYKLPDTMLLKLEGNEIEEARRLFYVALTRAKRVLAVSYPQANNNGKALEASQFVAELQTEAGLSIQEAHASQEAIDDYLATSLTDEEEPEITLLDSDYLDRLLQNYSLSVTHLNNYLRCPISFYFQNLLRVPAARNEYMTFGSAVHYALEQLFRKMLDHPEKQFPSIDIVVRDFEWFMKRYEDSFTPEQYENRLIYGRKILPEYYQQHLQSWNKVVSVERVMRNIEVNGVPINGKLDKLEFDGNKVVVVDYKTGKYANAKSKLKPPVPGASVEESKHTELNGGDYWRQAVFYQLLITEDQTNNWQMQQAVFDFVEPDEKSGQYQTETVAVSPEDEQIVRSQIIETYRNILDHKFEKGCGEPNCKWCTFVKYHMKQQNYRDENLLEPASEGNDQ